MVLFTNFMWNWLPFPVHIKGSPSCKHFSIEIEPELNRHIYFWVIIFLTLRKISWFLGLRNFPKLRIFSDFEILSSLLCLLDFLILRNIPGGPSLLRDYALPIAINQKHPSLVNTLDKLIPELILCRIRVSVCPRRIFPSLGEKFVLNSGIPKNPE